MQAPTLMRRRTTQLVALLVGLPVFVFLTLTLAEVGSGSSCHWKFPKWFGCVMAVHEGLAGGLIGVAGVLLGAWIAWRAVQQQINADRERAVADRVEVERLLAEDLTDYADGMAAAWRLLVELPNEPDPNSARPVCEATAYMANWISRSEAIADYRAMAEILNWDRRRKYLALLRGLDEFRQFSDPNSIHHPQEVLSVIHRVSRDFEYCLPATSVYFDGLWRRTPKAMNFADYVRRIGEIGRGHSG